MLNALWAPCFFLFWFTTMTCVNIIILKNNFCPVTLHKFVFIYIDAVKWDEMCDPKLRLWKYSIKSFSYLYVSHLILPWFRRTFHHQEYITLESQKKQFVFTLSGGFQCSTLVCFFFIILDLGKLIKNCIQQCTHRI